jgi:CheY-like chemotaxis protein
MPVGAAGDGNDFGGIESIRATEQVSMVSPSNLRHENTLKSMRIEEQKIAAREVFPASTPSVVAVDTVTDPDNTVKEEPVVSILIVDDSPANRKMVRRLLRNIAKEIREAGDGKEALKIMQEVSSQGGSVDVILMDDNMPNLTGPETARILRFRGYSGLICGVTGNTLPSDIKRFKDNGASCVLSKPLNIDLLKYYISQYSVGNLSVIK